jgi:hypothetical protein
MRRQVIRSLGLAGLVAAFALAWASPAGAGNNVTFQDPVGDNQGAGTANYAADIISLQVVSEDDGGMTFTLTVQTASGDGGVLYPNDFIEIDIDADSDPTTGDQGREAALLAVGQGPGQPPLAQICRFQEDSGQLACEAFSVGSVISPPNHVLTFRFDQANWFRIAIAVGTFYPRADSSCCNVDFAPDSGFFDFDVQADADHDGVSGFADECPTKPGGRFDRDGDGCPGPYVSLPPIRLRYDAVFKASSFVSYRGFGVTGVPRGVVVKARAGGKTYQRRGSGLIPGLNNRALPAGLVITFTSSKPGSCSSQRIIRIKPGASTGFITLRDAVVRPGGGIDCI